MYWKDTDVRICMMNKRAKDMHGNAFASFSVSFPVITFMFPMAFLV